ncbi:hypothetical protein [Mycobacterium sp. IDR2000157661]|nr:hypothetical protein [Mycobacterium sp. IDR2000157661]
MAEAGPERVDVTGRGCSLGRPAAVMCAAGGMGSATVIEVPAS